LNKPRIAGTKLIAGLYSTSETSVFACLNGALLYSCVFLCERIAPQGGMEKLIIGQSGNWTDCLANSLQECGATGVRFCPRGAVSLPEA
jgi:hypothetical protein